VAKKIMASPRRKARRPASRVAEFIAAIAAFWPVWSVVVMITAAVLGFHYFQSQVVIAQWKSLWESGSGIRVSRVVVRGPLMFVDKTQVTHAVEVKLRDGYLIASLEAVKKNIENIGWVKTASVKRIPPASIEVMVVEHRPMLRWKDQGYVETDGAIFKVKQRAKLSSLVMLDAPREQVASGLKLLAGVLPLIRQLGLRVQVLKRDVIGGWNLKSRTGLIIRLGRKNFHMRIARLVKVLPFIRKKGRPEFVDLRYANGAAVKYEPNNKSS